MTVIWYSRMQAGRGLLSKTKGEINEGRRFPIGLIR